MMFYDTNISKMCSSVKGRVRDVMVWFPYPALISFFLVTIFVGHLIPSLNSRFGSPAKLITFAADREPEGAIWISIYPGDDNKIHIKTIDMEDFSWPLANPTPEEIQPFIDYLKNKVEKVQIAAGINNEANYIKTSAVIATDIKLNYYHVKPILYALAEAKISNYGFETMLPGADDQHASMSNEVDEQTN